MIRPAFLAGAVTALLTTTAAVAQQATPDAPFPFAIGGPYALIDQHGRPRTEADPDGRLQLVFFGYANCSEICSAVLPQMGDAAEALQARGIAVTPVMITVDPDYDTPAVMAEHLSILAKDFIGLTGDPAALQSAYDAFAVRSEKVAQSPDGRAIYAHGSFVFLLDGSGKVLTLIPPILSLDQVVDLVAKYALQG